MKIGIAYNSSDSESEDKRSLEISINEAKEIADTIALELSSRYELIPFQVEPSLLSILSKDSVDLVINLCEGIGLNSRAEGWFAGYLDLLSIPYTKIVLRV